MGVADGGESKDQGGFGASSNFAFQSSSGVSAPPPDDDYQSFGNKHMPSNDGHYQRDHKIQKSEPPRDSNGESRFQDRQQQSSFSNFLKKRDQQPALFEEESAVLSTSVKFHDNDLHDAWEYSRFALRAMEVRCSLIIVFDPTNWVVTAFYFILCFECDIFCCSFPCVADGRQENSQRISS